MKRGKNRVLDPAEGPAAFTAKTLISMAFGIVASAGRVHLIPYKYVGNK
mgnify:CR=1 FL=1